MGFLRAIVILFILALAVGGAIGYYSNKDAGNDLTTSVVLQNCDMGTGPEGPNQVLRNFKVTNGETNTLRFIVEIRGGAKPTILVGQNVSPKSGAVISVATPSALNSGTLVVRATVQPGGAAFSDNLYSAPAGKC